jgi:hypothetical protein
VAQFYPTVTAYVTAARAELQDGISPYRYTDQQVVAALNRAIGEAERVRPDFFLDLKYQRPLRKGDTDDGAPPLYSTNDIAFQSDGVTYNPTAGTVVPIPQKYFGTFQWYITGWLQFFDMADTQDQRAQAFMAKFQGQLMTTTAA